MISLQPIPPDVQTIVAAIEKLNIIQQQVVEMLMSLDALLKGQGGNQ